MKYRIVFQLASSAEATICVGSEWQDSPKGLQCRVEQGNFQFPAVRYWVEEGKREAVGPVPTTDNVLALMEALRDSVTAAKARRANR